MLLDLSSKPIVVSWVDTSNYQVVNDGRGDLKVTPVTAMDTKITWGNLPRTNRTSKVLLQKSVNKDSGYTTIHSFIASKDYPYFLDTQANNTFHRHITEWYRLVIPETQTIIAPVCCMGVHDPVGAEIARRHMIRLKEGRCGNKCYVFKRMRDGARCPDCWDEITQQLCATDCPTCKGTGYIQGYFDGIPTYLNFAPEGGTVSVDTTGPVNTEGTIQAWTGHTPDISSGDVIVEPLGRRLWVANEVQVNTHRRLVTKQTITLDRSTGEDIIWDLVERLPAVDEDRGGGIRGY